MQTIAYSITAYRPNAHLFRVCCTIPKPNPWGQTVRLPSWIPGSYMLRDFARNIVRIEACDDNGLLAIEKVDTSRWRLAPAQGVIRLNYDVYAWDLSVRAAHLDANHGYFNGTSVFLLAEGFESCPCTVHIEAPPASVIGDWRLATSMQKSALDDAGFGHYCADNYADLIEHPVEMGQFERHIFSACGVEHELVLSGRFNTDGERICADLARICTWHIQLFGEPPPFEHYVFLVMVVGDGYGGLEHTSSTSLQVSRENLPVPDDPNISDRYLEFLGLCSHEYFHTWNVKRIRPQALLESTLEREAHTSLLWAFEGITSYYDDLCLVRCGLIDAERYLKLLGKTLTRVAQNPGRLLQSVAESSFDAWSKFYKQGENAPNAIVSYYSKGSLVALTLDLTLRSRSGGQKSLDDLMQLLWQRHGGRQGVGELGVEKLASELLGEDLGDFFDLAVRGTEELPLEQLLPTVGISLRWHSEHGTDYQAGHPPRVGSSALSQGMRLHYQQGLAVVANVLEDTAAQHAGISAGDTLLAIDGLRVGEKTLGDTLQRHRVGDTVEVVLFRRDELMRLSMTLRATPQDTASLLIDDSLAASVWLHTKPQ